VINEETKEILCTAQAEGSMHDFNLYKQTPAEGVDKHITIYADSGSQGIASFHADSRIPAKRKHNEALPSIDRILNRLFAERRIVIEHINALIKVFKIMAYPYRNHLRRHLLRMSLLCGIINYELKL
jgi:hypothetical protein